MKESSRKSIEINSDEKISMSQSFEKDGITKCIRVREVENGFIIDIEEYGYKKKEYYNHTKTYISKTNPLEDKEETKEPTFKEEVQNALKNLKI